VLYGNGKKTVQPPGSLEAAQIADTVGAGDAFSAVLAWGLQQGLRPEETLHCANELAEYMCTVSGAVPPDNRIYKRIRPS
jgi:fructokinase